MAKIQDVERLRKQINVFTPMSDEGRQLKDYMLELMELLWRTKKK